MGYNEMGEETLCNLIQTNKKHPGLDYVYCGVIVSYRPYTDILNYHLKVSENDSLLNDNETNLL